MVGTAAAAPPTPPAHRLIVDLVASEASPSRLLAIMRSVGLIPVTVHSSHRRDRGGLPPRVLAEPAVGSSTGCRPHWNDSLRGSSLSKAVQDRRAA